MLLLVGSQKADVLKQLTVGTLLLDNPWILFIQQLIRGF